MNDVMVWFAIAFGLLIAELVTGTFYLLMVAIGCAIAGVAALLGAVLPLQFVSGAGIGIAATMVLRRSRWGQKRLHSDAAENRDVILDIGEVVQVHDWRDGTAHVRYRGCRWDATLEPGATQRAGAQVIKAIRGSTLIVAPLP